MKVRLSGIAREDFSRLWEFIAERDPAAATNTMAALGMRVRDLGDQPRIGTPMADAPVRRWNVAGYVVYYAVVEATATVDEHVLVARIFHGREAR